MKLSPPALLGAMLAVSACSASGGTRAIRAEGRGYTQLLLAGRYDQLWTRFAPELRAAFASAGDLAAVAGPAVRELGVARGGVNESVSVEDSLRVYTRTSAVAGSGRRMMVQWTMAADGRLTGFLIRPAPSDSSGA